MSSRRPTELGASEIRPVLTDRTDAETVRTDRLQRIAVEAAEQTERLDVPPVREAMKLEQALAGWDEARILIYADEAGDEGAKPWGGEAGRARPIADVLKAPNAGAAAILIGPEGGLHSRRAKAPARPVPMSDRWASGPRILRAETAAVAALAL